MGEPVSFGSKISLWFNRTGWRDILIATPYGWMFVFFFLPFLIVVAMSLARVVGESPPFAFLDAWPYVQFDNFQRLFQDSLFIRAFLISLYNATITMILCLIIGFPMALCLTRVSRAWRNLLLMLVILPFWTSFLLRVYAWIGLMNGQSWFNRGLTAAYNTVVPADWAIQSIQMTNTNFAVILVLVYSYLPFMVLPLYASLERLDPALDEAALDLGSRPWQVFRDITLPLAVPGMIAGGLLVFIPASGELIIPSLVGNAADPMIGRVINDQFAQARDWPMASAVASALLFLLVFPMMAYRHFEAKDQARRDMES